MSRPTEGELKQAVGEAPDHIVTSLVDQDKVPWYLKRNLRKLYILLFPTCIGVEMTSGFDSSMMNGLQAVSSWNSFYHSPRSTILGVMSAMYSLGAIVALPLVPYITDALGRRRAIMFVRARGITIFQWWSRAAGFFNQFVNPIGIANAGWKYYISYCIFLLFEVFFVYFLFPETSNRTLEELAFLYEGDQLRQEQQKRVEQDIQQEQDTVSAQGSAEKPSSPDHIEHI